MLIVFLFLINREKIVFLPPAKEPKKMTITLANFKTAPKPKPLPKPKPALPSKKTAPILEIPQPIVEPQVVSKETLVTSKIKTELIKDDKKLFVAQKTDEENNETIEKIVKKEIIKKEIIEKKIVAKPIKQEPKKEKITKKEPIKKMLTKKEPTEQELLEKRRARVKRIEEAHKKQEAKELAQKRERIQKLKEMEEEMRIAEAKHNRELQKIRARRDNFEEPSKQYTSSDLTSALMQGNKSKNFQPRSDQALNRAASTRLINQLYGNEFDSYTSQQKKFLKANLGRIHMLTQRALVRNGYPEVSVRMGQEGVNIVSFYLHPNGNITQLRLEKAIGYTALDENTLRVIRIAYSEYPLPQMRTKIKFYVNYTIN